MGTQWAGLFLGVLRCPEPPGAPCRGTGAEFGHRSRAGALPREALWPCMRAHSSWLAFASGESRLILKKLRQATTYTRQSSRQATTSVSHQPGVAALASGWSGEESTPLQRARPEVSGRTDLGTRADTGLVRAHDRRSEAAVPARQAWPADGGEGDAQS